LDHMIKQVIMCYQSAKILNKYPSICSISFKIEPYF